MEEQRRQRRERAWVSRGRTSGEEKGRAENECRTAIDAVLREERGKRKDDVYEEARVGPKVCV